MINTASPIGVVEKNGRVWMLVGHGHLAHEWIEITDTAPWNADE